MESSNQRGQVLIECMVIVVVITIILICLLNFHAPGWKTEMSWNKEISNLQIRDLSIYKNGVWQ